MLKITKLCLNLSKVMTKILWPLFFPDTVYIASAELCGTQSVPLQRGPGAELLVSGLG